MTSSLNKAVWSCFAGLAVVFMLSPLMILVLFCFSEGALLSFPITGLSLRWFEALLARDQFWGALENSLIVTGSVGLISTVVGTMTAMGLARMRSDVSLVVMMVLTIPIMVPPLMLGIVFLSYFHDRAENWSVPSHGDPGAFGLYSAFCHSDSQCPHGRVRFCRTRQRARSGRVQGLCIPDHYSADHPFKRSRGCP